jgi:hypothetical protein
MKIENETLTEYEPFSDDENVKIEDDLILKIKPKTTNILITNENVKIEDDIILKINPKTTNILISNQNKVKLQEINKKQIKRKNLLRIIARR